MLVIGLTGNIGSGKSTVAQLLSERGATIIDADVLARRAVEFAGMALGHLAGRTQPGPDRGRVRMRRHLLETMEMDPGQSVPRVELLAPDGHLDRGALRRTVFSDPKQLEELNEIVHPEVESLRQRLLDDARQRGDRVVVCDIPLLFEKHMAPRFDRIILVDAPRPLRLERLVRDRALRETEAMDMIAAQMPAELKRAGADFILENADTLNSLEQQVADVWTQLVQEADAGMAISI